MKEGIFIDAQAAKIRRTSQIRIEVDEVQNSFLRLCNFDNPTLRPNQLISKKQIRLERPVTKLSYRCMKSVCSSSRNRCYSVDTFGDELIIGKGHLKRNIGGLIDPVGNLEKSLFIKFFVSEYVELLYDFSDISLILPLIEPAPVKVWLHLFDIVEREYRIFFEVLPELDILHDEHPDIFRINAIYSTYTK